jgi:glycolate oxidase FAD binding subunit
MARRAVGAKRSRAARNVSTNAVQSAMREAISSRKPVRIAGGGSWMNAGRPVAATQSISLSADKGVVDYVPDDLTITVRAGTTLAEIAAATAANDQWLPLDPVGAGASTIGATIATASSGPLAHSFGFARDFILGLEFVTGKGDVVRSGGRVVKNVAGFDMMRLMCGAWGTLGVITQATLRLYARPKVDRTFALAVPAQHEAAASFLESLRMAQLSALSMEEISAPFALKLGLPENDTILVRLGGNSDLVDVQIDLLRGLGSPAEMSSELWSSFNDVAAAPSDFALRLSGLPADIRSLWRAAASLVDQGRSGFIHSTFSRGIVRVAASAGVDEPAIPKSVASQRVAYEVLPPNMWAALSPSVISDPLSRNIQRAYDPDSLLNPGILG